MTENKTAVIIGAGIGGIATAIYLAKDGYNVTVYEKNSAPGGRCGQLIRDGHRFDLGATMLMMPGIYRQVFQSLGISLFENNDINPLEDLYKIYFDDNEVIAFSPNENKMKIQLEKIEQGSFEKSQKYVSDGYEIFQIGINKMIGRNFYNLFQFVNFKNAGMLIKLKTYISNYRYVKKFFRHPHLRMAYTFQNIYVGQSPFNSPALFSMVPAAELTEGSFFPKGGMFAIVEKLFSSAKSKGVLFHFNDPVSGINVSGNKAESILLYDGTDIKADIIVANADLPFVYRELLPDKKKSKQLDSMKYSCSAICYHWGLDKVYPQLGHHSVFLSDGFRHGLNRIFKDKSVSDHPSFYVHAPARTDSSASPHNLKWAATPCAIFSYLVHIIRDFQKDQLNNLCYFADDLIIKNGLSRHDLREFAEGSPVNNNFRKIIKQYYLLADEYRLKTYDVIKEISPQLEPRYQLSLEIIFNLYLMVFERIDLQHGRFTTEELNPTPEETKKRVLNTIMNFKAELL